MYRRKQRRRVGHERHPTLYRSDGYEVFAISEAQEMPGAAYLAFIAPDVRCRVIGKNPRAFTHAAPYERRSQCVDAWSLVSPLRCKL